MTNIILSYIHRNIAKNSAIFLQDDTLLQISFSDQPPNSTYTTSLFNKTTPEPRSSNSNAPSIYPINLLLVNISMHLNANTFVSCEKNSYPCTIPILLLFLALWSKCTKTVGSRVEKRKLRKEGSTEGSAEGRVQVLLVGVLVVPFEGGALQEARGRSGCKGIVTWPRGRYRFLVAARYKRET